MVHRDGLALHECGLLSCTQGLDSNQGPEKIKVIYEATFRPVQGDRSGAEPSTSAVSPKPKKATVTALAGHPAGRADVGIRRVQQSTPQLVSYFGGPGLRLQRPCMQNLHKGRRDLRQSRGHAPTCLLPRAMRSASLAHL